MSNLLDLFRYLTSAIHLVANQKIYYAVIISNVEINTSQDESPNARAFDESAADDFEMELARATPEEKQECLERVEVRQTSKAEQTIAALEQLQEVARSGGNVFEELMRLSRLQASDNLLMHCSRLMGNTDATCRVLK